MLNGLDLFSGYGGITLALQQWVRPLAYCEIERYAQGILLSRMLENRLPRAPIASDVTELCGKPFYGRVDIIYGGFPCQDISVAGAQVGLGGERSGLVFEIFRLLDETAAPFLFLENVPNIRTKGAETVSKELAERGYDSRWCMLSASDVGANHKRERWFLLAFSNSRRRGAMPTTQGLQAECEGLQSEDREAHTNNAAETGESRADVPYSSSMRLYKGASERVSEEWKTKLYEEFSHDSCKRSRRETVADSQHDGSSSSEKQRGSVSSVSDDSEGENSTEQSQGSDISRELPRGAEEEPSRVLGNTYSLWELQQEGIEQVKRGWVGNSGKEWMHWAVEPDVGRVVNGTSFRVDRIKAIGNGVVPLQVKEAFKMLMGIGRIK